MDRVKDNKPQLNKTILLVITTIYLVIIVFFVYTVLQIPRVQQRLEIDQIEYVQTNLNELLNSTADIPRLQADLDNFIEQTPMELIIKKNRQTIYTTFPGLELSDLSTIIHKDATSFRQQATLRTTHGEYDVFLSVYPPTATSKINRQFTLLTIYTTLMFIAFIIMIFLLNKMLISPLSFIRTTISKMRQFKFDEIEAQSDNLVAKEFNEFTTHVADRFGEVNEKYTQLEFLLLMEKERLKQLIYMSRAYIHELKTPLHQMLLQNEVLSEKISNNSQAQEVSKYNLEHLDATMLRINEILKIMNQSLLEDHATTTFDFVELYEKIEEKFLYFLNERNIFIETTLPETFTMSVNKNILELILHNLLANIAEHTVQGSDAAIDIQITPNNEIKLILKNQITREDAQNIQQFNKPLNELMIAEHSYSSGNGIRLTRELIYSVQGDFQITIEDDQLTVVVILPQ